MRIACTCAMILLVAAAGVWAHETVVRDYIGPTNAWVDGLGLLPHFLDTMPGWSAAAAAPVQGNGEFLRRITIVFGYGGEGDPGLLKYHLRVYPDPPASLVDPAGALVDRGGLGPPLNADWRSPFGIFDPNGTPGHPSEQAIYLYRVTIDVREARAWLEPGRCYAVELVPETGEPVSTIWTSLSLSRGGAGAVGTASDWYQDEFWGDGVPPVRVSDLGIAPDFNYFAYTITTVSSPADLNHDGRVNQEDLLLFTDCARGPGVRREDADPCRAADFDGDEDVDMIDYSVLQRCYSGDRLADAGCGEYP